MPCLIVKLDKAFLLFLDMEKISIFERFQNSIESKGITVLRISVGLVFLWFGFLKFFENVSDAEDIAAKTISWLTLDTVKPAVSMPMLAVLECFIGLGILTKKYMKFVIPVLYFQMAGTLLPLLIFPEKTWKYAPFVPTLEGQYIIKNSILISAGIVLGVISKGGKLIRNPRVAKKAKAEEEKIENN